MLRGRIKAGEDRPFLSRQNPAALPVTLPSPLRPAVSERLRPLPGGAAPAAAAAPAPRAERAGRGAPHTAPGDFPLPPPGTHGPAVRGFRRRRGLSAPDGGTAPLQPSRCRVLGVRHRRQPVVVAAECPPPPTPAPAQSCPGRESPHGGHIPARRLERRGIYSSSSSPSCSRCQPSPERAGGTGGPRGSEPPPRAPPAAAAAVTPPWGRLRSQPPLRRRGCSSLAGGYPLKLLTCLEGYLFIF